jgi:hypothetical protein
MTKKKTKPSQKQPAAPPSIARLEPTQEQLTQLGALTKQVADFSTAHGPVSAEGVSEPVGATLAESMKRVEGLLGTARALFEKAHSLETTNKVEADRLATQKREQEEAIRQKKKASDDEIANAQKTVDQQEFDVLARIDVVSKREAAARMKEAWLAEQSAGLAERELNAEQRVPRRKGTRPQAD